MAAPSCYNRRIQFVDISMKFSWVRAVQWVSVFAGIVFFASLEFKAPSEAGKTVNAPIENRLEQGLVGYWKLDDGTGTNATDSSGNANTLAMTGSPSWVTGNIGPSALDFSGSGQYLSVADPASGVLDFVDGADFTISGWFNRDTAAADHTIVAKKNDQTTNAGYVVWIDNNGSTDYLSAEISDGTDTYSAIGTTDLSATGWHHFSVVWDDATGLYIYLDGKLDGSTTSSTASINSLANANAFRIGAESDAGVPFDGKIDDVKLYGKTLSADQVLTLYETTVPVAPASTVGLDSGLVGHWTFDGPDVRWADTSNEIKDVSGRGNHGDAVGLTTASVIPGKLGQALSFNGTSDYVNAGSGSSLDNLTNRSICAWIFPDTASVADSVLAIQWELGSNHYWAFYLETGSVNFSTIFSSGAYWGTAGSLVVANTWQHVCVTYNQSSATNDPTFYYNGLPRSLSTVYNDSGSHQDESGGDVIFGHHVFYDTFYAGKMDDIRMYNRILSASEILSLYNLGQ